MTHVMVRVPLGPAPRHPAMCRVDAHYMGRRAEILARIAAGVAPSCRISDKAALDALLDAIASAIEQNGAGR